VDPTELRLLHRDSRLAAAGEGTTNVSVVADLFLERLAERGALFALRDRER
jgi:hypothetical protein